MENFHIIRQEETEEVQLRTKNEVMLIEFDDPEKRQIFDLIVKKYADQPSKLKLFNKRFIRSLENKFGKEKVFSVLEELRDFDILPQPLYRYINNEDPDSENGQAQQKGPPKEERYMLTSVNLLIIGSKLGVDIMKQKASPLKFKSIETKSFKDKWDKSSVENAIKEADFMIVESSQWNPDYLQWINKQALSRNLPWLLVEGLNLSQIKVGPIFFGRETACYNCLVKRLESNKDEVLLDYDKQYENYLLENDLLSKPDQSLFNPVQLYEILANLALIEITKYFKYWSVPALWGHYVALDVFTFKMERHRVLKVPHCLACKPKLEYNSSPWLETIALKND